MCSPLSVSIVIKVRLRNNEKQRSLEAKKQITSNIKEAGSLESVFSLFLSSQTCPSKTREFPGQESMVRIFFKKDSVQSSV